MQNFGGKNKEYSGIGLFKNTVDVQK